MKRIIILFLLIFISSTSCKKKTTVTIQAQDYITGSGAAYAWQKYVVNETWTPSQEVKVKTVSEGFLDQNGFASFELKMKNSRKYILAVDQPENICYGGVTQHYLEHEKSNIIEFGYAGCAYIKFNFNNTNCFDAFDDFKFYYMGRQIPGKEGLVGSLAKSGIGCYSYTSTDFSVVPAGSYYYKWDIIRNGNLTTVFDTITLNEGEYFVYDVNY